MLSPMDKTFRDVPSTPSPMGTPLLPVISHTRQNGKDDGMEFMLDELESSTRELDPNALYFGDSFQRDESSSNSYSAMFDSSMDMDDVVITTGSMLPPRRSSIPSVGQFSWEASSIDGSRRPSPSSPHAEDLRRTVSEDKGSASATTQSFIYTARTLPHADTEGQACVQECNNTPSKDIQEPLLLVQTTPRSSSLQAALDIPLDVTFPLPPTGDRSPTLINPQRQGIDSPRFASTSQVSSSPRQKASPIIVDTEIHNADFPLDCSPILPPSRPYTPCSPPPSSADSLVIATPKDHDKKDPQYSFNSDHIAVQNPLAFPIPIPLAPPSLCLTPPPFKDLISSPASNSIPHGNHIVDSQTSDYSRSTSTSPAHHSISIYNQYLDPFVSPTRSMAVMDAGLLGSGNGMRSSGGWDYDQDVIDPHPPSRLPYQHPRQKPSPSVPLSTRSASSASGPPPESKLPDIPSDLTSPLATSFINSSIKRSSKFTGTSSSSSSIHTAETNSHRGSGQQHWHLAGPDISTVFEEGTVDVNLEKEPSLDLSFPNKYKALVNQSSTAKPLVHKVSNRSRTDTLSSNHSKDSKNHPFATANRPASPLSAGAKAASQLRPFSPSLSSTRSSPNLAEAIKMAAVPSAPAHQVALVSMDDKEDEENCPVCVESLSFTFRLPGEKPHIVPECGHALHEECFVTVYGEVPREGSRRNLGVCGVCRMPMKLSDGGERRGKGQNKLAMLTGQGGSKPASSTIRNTPSRPSVQNISEAGQFEPQIPSDPNTDDPLEVSAPMTNSGSSRSANGGGEHGQVQVVVPSISMRSEFPSIARGGNRKGKQAMTAMVSVEVPPAGDRPRYPPKAKPMETRSSGHSSPQLPPSPRSASSFAIDHPSSRSAASTQIITPDSFAHVVTDLKSRVVDYKTSGLDQLGGLRLFDLLAVRKGSLVRDFHVYLFQEALICISEEKKSGFRQIFSSGSSVRSHDSNGTSASGRGILKLKGRIYMRHVRKVLDSSVQGELSLTISMEDESMDSFILVFKDRSSHETWRSGLTRLLEEKKGHHAAQSANKIAKLMGSGAPTPSTSRSQFSPMTVSSSNFASPQGFGDMMSPLSAFSNGYASSSIPPSSPMVNGHSQPSGPGDLAYNQPLAPMHTPIDLVVILSLPAPSSSGSQPLKIKLIRQAIQFVLATVGPRDRVSLVACEMGTNGSVRKTPFLNTTRYESRKRLEAFIELLGTGKVEEEEFKVHVGPEERQDVVTAVNIALDVVLQRKAKNPLTGMILLSDTSDIIKRAQMDLVTARLDAANVPVHALGYGKSHDPSPLWMISNHTHGTYTFVKEWYHLRDAMAGVLGGLMSIALTNMKLHLACQDNDFKVTKVSGVSSAIVSTDGKHVDIELRELRHGETREILLELDLEGPDDGRYSQDGSEGSGQNGSIPPSRGGSFRKSSPSVEQQIRGLGLESVSGGDIPLYEDALIDEVPVTEVDCSFHDPAAGRSVARLAHPVLLTVAVLPPNVPAPSSNADPTVIRRRMELLASDMITRALLIASRKNFSHAVRIIKETKRIVETITDNLRGSAPRGHARSKRELQTLLAIEGLNATIGDVDTLLDGLEEHKEMFERDHRNYAAQQAIVLRSQKSWTIRTPTERLYCTRDVQSIIQSSGEWSPRQ